MTLLNLGKWGDDRFERMVKAGWQDPGGPRRWRVEPRTCPLERSRVKTARQERDTPPGTIQRGGHPTQNQGTEFKLTPDSACGQGLAETLWSAPEGEGLARQSSPS